MIEEPDFVLSLGTGEPTRRNELSTEAPRRKWKNKAFARLCRLFWEKIRDKQVRQAFRGHPRYHRLDLEFDGEEPRLDDTQSMPELKAKTLSDPALLKGVESVARCLVASLFYFELESMPAHVDGKYLGSGRILCSLRCNEPAFQELFDQLAKSSSLLLLNNVPLAAVNDISCFGSDGNYRKKVDFNTPDRFSICLKQGDSEPCHIGRSPLSVEKLIAAQGLDACFGRSDHRKRKASDALVGPVEKRRSAGLSQANVARCTFDR